MRSYVISVQKQSRVLEQYRKKKISLPIIQYSFKDIDDNSADSIMNQFIMITDKIISNLSNLQIFVLPQKVKKCETAKTKLVDELNRLVEDFKSLYSNYKPNGDYSLCELLDLYYTKINESLIKTEYGDLWGLDIFKEWKQEAFNFENHSQLGQVLSSISKIEILSRKEAPDYDSNDLDITKLKGGRLGNSTTLDDSSRHYDETAISKWENADKYMHEECKKLTDKTLSPAILLEIFMSINGKLRGIEHPTFRFDAVKLVGEATPAPIEIPAIIMSVMNLICNTLNGITEKRQRRYVGIELAGRAYQILISLHPFEDGNGRTCRLFSDFILMYSGLPPAIPNANIGKLYVNLNEGKIQSDENAAYESYKEGVDSSYRILQKTPKTYEKIQDIENLLNELSHNNWAYVGGYASYLLAKEHGLVPIDFNDYDIVVPKEYGEHIKKNIYGESATELPQANGHDISIIPSESMPETLIIGSARIATSKFIGENYLRMLEIKYALKGGLKKNLDTMDEKDKRRYSRYEQMQIISTKSEED